VRQRHQWIESFKGEDREIARARGLAKTTLLSWGLASDVPALELLVSELMTNAVQHGTAPIQMRLSSDGEQIRLEVADVGPVAERPRSPQAERLGGWGLRFVDQLTESWGTQHDKDGTMVWTVTRTAKQGNHRGDEAG
jgi:anti-sigma regulatory factor (Ser/Thr protein kinase)